VFLQMKRLIFLNHLPRLHYILLTQEQITYT